MSESKLQIANKRLAQLKAERDSWNPRYRELAENFLPHKSRWLLDSGEANKGQARNRKLIDGSPRYAARTLASGLMAGLTSPARPWMRLITPDPDMMELQSVKDWLQQVETRMRDVFSKSNLYNVLPTLYGELGVFGTAAMIVLEDEREVIRCRPYTCGSYFLSNNSRLTVDTMYCEYKMTVRQLKQEFGEDNLSTAVKGMLRSNQLENWVDVVHLVQPNADREYGKVDAKNMPVKSCYYEKTASEDKFLRESGFEEFPVMAPRWEPNGEDVYGSSPAMDGLGDAKALQHQQKQKAKQIDKLTDPPMWGTPELKSQKSSLLPGDMTYSALAGTGTVPFQPVYVPNPQGLVALREDIIEKQKLISRAMYEDMFLMLALSDRRQITAEEIARKQEEKLLMLGPVLERLNDELLDPFNDRVFNAMFRRGMLPEPPPELEGVDLKVEYISILAQAQRMVSTSGIDRLAAFATQIAPIHPDILDKVDFDQAVDEYGNALGVPVRIIRSDDDVAKMRATRQQQQQAAQMAAMAQPAAQVAGAAKDLSETDVGGISALDRMAGVA